MEQSTIRVLVLSGTFGFIMLMGILIITSM